jgi:hypothetical protein
MGISSVARSCLMRKSTHGSVHPLTKIIHSSPHEHHPSFYKAPRFSSQGGFSLDPSPLRRAPALGILTLHSVGVLFCFFNRQSRPSHLTRKVSPQPRTPRHSLSYSHSCASRSTSLVAAQLLMSARGSSMQQTVADVS